VLHHAYPVYQRMKRRAKGRVFAIDKAGAHGEEQVFVSWQCRFLPYARIGAIQDSGHGKGRIFDELGLLIYYRVRHTIPAW
jgi:hypothetical protein